MKIIDFSCFRPNGAFHGSEKAVKPVLFLNVILFEKWKKVKRALERD